VGLHGYHGTGSPDFCCCLLWDRPVITAVISIKCCELAAAKIAVARLAKGAVLVGLLPFLHTHLCRKGLYARHTKSFSK
jgi:hypothetical protein